MGWSRTFTLHPPLLQTHCFLSFLFSLSILLCTFSQTQLCLQNSSVCLRWSLRMSWRIILRSMRDSFCWLSDEQMQSRNGDRRRMYVPLISLFISLPLYLNFLPSLLPFVFTILSTFYSTFPSETPSSHRTGNYRTRWSWTGTPHKRTPTETVFAFNLSIVDSDILFLYTYWIV